jgi:hypothetical protein
VILNDTSCFATLEGVLQGKGNARFNMAENMRWFPEARLAWRERDVHDFLEAGGSGKIGSEDDFAGWADCRDRMNEKDRIER